MRRLLTEAGERLPEIPWAEDYPRPLLRRADWLCLNGVWSLTFGGQTRDILVPFCPESLLSGVGDAPRVGERLVYRRAFAMPSGWRGRRVLLHFGAVSRQAEVCVNGLRAASHENGYLPFSADVTDLLRPGENELTVTAVNDLDPVYPYGKQREKRGGMWYTPVSGIWQTVWLEPVPEARVRALRVREVPGGVEITAEGVSDGVVTLEGRDWPLRGGAARVALERPERWSPEHPRLYRYGLTAGEDRVESYFALRTLDIREVAGAPRLCLNGEPYFFHGLLDQGYWSDGLYTPASPEAYAEDIRAMKALGFNTLRKHIKLEPERFYYECDRLGMIVFQDMVNNGRYRYLRDTALPNLGFTRRGDRRMHRDPKTRQVFLDSMAQTVSRLDGHPCVCLWTIFNEGWGQFCADDACRRLRALDPTRFIDAASGWFSQHESDVESQHIYFSALRLGEKPLPQLLSEIGGWSMKLPEHSANSEKTYGYRKYEDRSAFVRDLRALYLEQVLPLIPQGLCGAVYTQVSDVEDETNGLLTFDRRAAKVRPEEFADVSEALRQAVPRG